MQGVQAQTKYEQRPTGERRANPRETTESLDGRFRNAQGATSLVVQWSRLHASSPGGLGSILGQRTKILQTAWHGQKKKQITAKRKKNVQGEMRLLKGSLDFIRTELETVKTRVL